MKSDNAIRNSTSIFVGIIVAIAAFVRGALLLPLLLVACSVWGCMCCTICGAVSRQSPRRKQRLPAALNLWCRTLRMNLSATFCCSM